MAIYILSAGETSMVKIGWTENDAEERRRELQTAHWEALTVMRVIDALPWVERAMHRKFAEQRVLGEWFRFHPDMLTVSIADLQKPALPEKPPLGEPEAGLSAETVKEIERRAKASGLTINDVCRKADVAVSTFWRWKNGRTNPRLDICRKLLEASS
jgi:DNA-binding XRE family transcriptional regulator